MEYVIIGNSAAAVGCIEGIRQVDQTGGITVISDEKYHTYSRPLISYLLLGETTEANMYYRPADFYKKNNVTFMPGKTVTAIDPKAHQICLDDGAKISYDKLLYATGSSPFVPPMQGLERVKKQFTFMTLDSAKALDKALDSSTRVLIVGAGLIGLKCAEGIRHKVADVTVVDLAPNILSSILDEDAAAMMQKHLENHGLRFYLNDSVQQFTEDTATLKSGAQIPFDVVVLAVGVRPNTALLENAGGKVNRGVVINNKMKSSLPDIYAAGDCTRSHDISSDTDRILALLPNAYMQGETAGINMAGGKAVFDKAIPMNAIGFFGLHIITAGSYTGKAYTKIGENTYKKLFVSDGLLKGYILIGDIDRAGIYTSLIREQTPLSDIDFDLVFEKPGLLAFSREKRAQILGGAKE